MKQEQATKIYNEDQTMSFLISANVPIGEVHDFVTQLDSLVINRINEAKTQRDDTKKETIKDTDVKPTKEEKNERDNMEV